MKKSPKVRLTLHRETLRTLAGPEIEAAQGGELGTRACSLYRTCSPTSTCPTLPSGCCPTTATLLC